MINYIFDVDGTLTPARQKIDPYFKEFFNGWRRHKTVSILTGSDAWKTIRQLGNDLWSDLICYQCAGNEIFSNGKLVYHKAFPKEVADKLKPLLEQKWRLSNCPFKLGENGRHIEERAGMINFSVVGRRCSDQDRMMYRDWDFKVGEREKLQKELQSMFPDLEVNIGGEISLDIFPKGRDKSLVYEYLYRSNNPIYFFGDKTQPGGNDFPLVKALKEGELEYKVFQVSGPAETEFILRGLK